MENNKSQPKVTKETSVSSALLTETIKLAHKHYGREVAELIKLLSTNPLRLSEILPLKYTDLVKKESGYSLRVPNNKNSIENKTLFISEETYLSLEALMKKNPKNTYFFESKRSTNRANKEPTYYSRQFLSKVLKNIGEMTKKPFTFNEIRLTAIRNIMRTNPEHLPLVMSHEKIILTEYYLHQAESSK
jgi:integrase